MATRKRTTKKKATTKRRRKTRKPKKLTAKRSFKNQEKIQDLTEETLAGYRVQPAKREFANKLRRSMSPPEGKIWHRLRFGFGGVEWFSQAIVIGYVADFFCPEKRIVVEVDSSYHVGREKADAKRDADMGKFGIKVLRIQASDINRNISAELMAILRLVEATEDNLWPAQYK